MRGEEKEVNKILIMFMESADFIAYYLFYKLRRLAKIIDLIWFILKNYDNTTIFIKLRKNEIKNMQSENYLLYLIPNIVCFYLPMLY